MLDVAHASAHHWAHAGDELNRMRAAMLVAEVHALLGMGPTALALADDLSRVLAGEVPKTRPVGAVGRAARKIRRRPWTSLLVGIFVLVASIGGAWVAGRAFMAAWTLPRLLARQSWPRQTARWLAFGMIATGMASI